ncbi:MAG: LemA family protein [Acidimicrobiales bacterium]
MPALMATLIAAIGAVLLWQSFSDQRMRRLIVDTPTSKARGVFIGFNEVVGTATADRPLLTRFSREPCVFHDYVELQEIRRRRNDSQGSRRSWIRAGSDRRAVLFEVADDTGAVGVDPSSAEIIGTRIVDTVFEDTRRMIGYSGRSLGGEGATGRFKRREDAIRVGDEVYVLGHAHLVDDGTRAEIRAEPGFPLYITTMGEAALTRRFAWRGTAMAVLAAIAVGAAGVVLATPDRVADAILPAVAGVALVAVANAAHTLLLVYNGLVRLRERESRAWSLIEVQLNRRGELIPQLVTCVSTYASLEADTQQQIAGLRSGTWTDTGHELPDEADIEQATETAARQTDTARSLIGLAEAHPELKADELFAQLSDQLVDSENRIALARGYFNDSVTALADRARTFPASIVANRMNLGTRRHLTFGGDEQ